MTIIKNHRYSNLQLMLMNINDFRLLEEVLFTVYSFLRSCIISQAFSKAKYGKVLKIKWISFPTTKCTYCKLPLNPSYPNFESI